MSFEDTRFSRELLTRLTLSSYDVKTWQAFSKCGNGHGVPDLATRARLVRDWTAHLGNTARFQAWTEAVSTGLRSYYDIQPKDHLDAR